MTIIKSKLKDTICDGLKSYYSLDSVDECNADILDSTTLTTMSQRYMLWFNKVGFKPVYSCSKGVASDAIIETSPHSFDALLAADDSCYNWSMSHYRGSIMVDDVCLTGKTIQNVYDNCFTQLMTIS